MPIQYVCLGCREEMVLPDQKAGQLCACPRCRLKFLAPPPSVNRPASPGGSMAPRAAPAGGAPPPLYPAAPASGRGGPVRLSTPEPKPAREEAPAPGSGLFGMGSSGGGGGGGLFGQGDVQVGALFGGAGVDEEEAVEEEAEEAVEEEATDHAGPPDVSTPSGASPRPAFPAPGRPGSAPPGYRAPQQPPYPGYHPAPQSPPTGYPQPYGAPQQPYGAPQGAPQQPQGYPPPGYPPQGYPPGYGPPPGYVPGYPGYPGYPPQGGGYPYPQYPGYPPGYPHQPTPAGGVPIGPQAHEPAASGPPPDLISMDDVYARKAPASPPPSVVAGGRGCRLVVLDGLPEGTEFHLPAGKIYDIGRDKEADVKILSTSVSRRQARIDATGGSPVLIDCGSANGTQVNGELVGRHPLREGDLIKMGKVLFRYQSA
jgi:DNA-directed RNA polymerase subunit RPC12/RpoP